MARPTRGGRSLPGTLLHLTAAALVGRWHRFVVAEDSMRPTLQAGDRVIGMRSPHSVRVGDVIVCDLPRRPGFEIVKRVSATDPGDGSLWLAGDDPGAGSVDSSAFGSVPPEAVSARILIRYRPFPPRLVR